MCPLRLILIFLSATLAGFFVIKNINSQSQPQTQTTDDDDDDDDDPSTNTNNIHRPKNNAFSKVRAVVESGFWTFVDMASGRYLWKHLVSSNSKAS